MDFQKVIETLESHGEYRKYLYVRGFCISDSALPMEGYPFYNLWNHTQWGNVHFYIHPEKTAYFYEQDDIVYFLIGHAYDSFSNLSREEDILKKLAGAYDFWTATSDLTGVFCVGRLKGDNLEFTPDAAGQQLVYYGTIQGNRYVTSHSRLVGDFCELKQDPYITELVNYRFYHFFGNVLPGDRSPYKELRRAQCNFFVTMQKNEVPCFKRFWPTEPVVPCTDYDNVITEISEILRKNMELIAKKWPGRVAISVTGGMDSKTTMACSNGLYDKFQYFSYDSLPDERVDADAARELCEKLGLDHTLYEIPMSDAEYENLEFWHEIFSMNAGSVGYSHDNDVKKRLFFSKNNDFDVEVKSWVDEIGRARYHKRYGKKSFPACPTARYCTSFYKAFLHNRALVKKTDCVFSDFLDMYYGNNVLSLIPWWDLFYWEFEWNAAEGAFLTGELSFAYETTIPFNNRRLLELMLTVPLEKRINDEIQKDVISRMNERIAKSGIHVQDVSHTKNRARLERAYLEINTHIPF